jgi:cold shock CspA family protein
VFFFFTAIPGEGYRALDAGVPVRFELVESATWRSVRTIQRVDG